MNEWKKFYFNISNYCKYGLYTDDIADDSYTPEIKEAVRRLPADQFYRRNYRQLRASQLEINKEYLPKDQWITYEEDLEKGHYLKPYVKEVLAEWKEKSDWEKTYN